jgi:hypothetical protein
MSVAEGFIDESAHFRAMMQSVVKEALKHCTSDFIQSMLQASAMQTKCPRWRHA